MGERGSEIAHLLLADALGITGQDLGLDLINGSGNGREEQLPTDSDVLWMWYRTCSNREDAHLPRKLIMIV